MALAAIKRRKAIWEEMNPGGGKSVSTNAGIREVGFASDTAAVAGITKQAINQHVARAEALGDGLEAVVGTSLDKGVEQKLPAPPQSVLPGYLSDTHGM